MSGSGYFLGRPRPLPLAPGFEGVFEVDAEFFWFEADELEVRRSDLKSGFSSTSDSLELKILFFLGEAIEAGFLRGGGGAFFSATVVLTRVCCCLITDGGNLPPVIGLGNGAFF